MLINNNFYFENEDTIRIFYYKNFYTFYKDRNEYLLKSNIVKEIIEKFDFNINKNLYYRSRHNYSSIGINKTLFYIFKNINSIDKYLADIKLIQNKYNILSDILKKYRSASYNETYSKDFIEILNEINPILDTKLRTTDDLDYYFKKNFTFRNIIILKFAKFILNKFDFILNDFILRIFDGYYSKENEEFSITYIKYNFDFDFESTKANEIINLWFEFLSKIRLYFIQSISEDELNLDYQMSMYLTTANSFNLIYEKKSTDNYYIRFYSIKNKLFLEKFDNKINFNNHNELFSDIFKITTTKFYERVQKKGFKYTKNLIKKEQYTIALYLLDTLSKLQGTEYEVKGYGGWSVTLNIEYPPFVLDEFISLYFEILYGLKEYQFIIENYENIKINVNILQIACDCFCDTKDFQKALEVLDKLEYYEPSLGYIKTKRNKINREIKISNYEDDNSQIDGLSGIEFEKILTDKFNELGFFAEQTKGSGDFGADIIVETKLQSKIIIQCKRFNTKVNLKAVQEVIGAIGHYEADIGIVITNNEFLNSAKKLAKSNDVELWDRDKLSKFLSGDISFSILKEI